MNASDFFLPVFLEHMASATIVPFVSSITLEAMRLFGTYDLMVPALFGVLGLLCGCVMNWALGYGLRLVHCRVMLSSTPSDEISLFMARYGWMGAVLFWLPLASIMLVVLGFFRVSPLRVGVMVLVGSLFHMRDIFLA